MQLKLLAILLFGLLITSNVFAKNGCDTGASALGNAFVRMNPIYAYYFGSLESYVKNNREHFIVDGDAIRCAEALSSALFNKSVSRYDPNALRRKQELDARLRNMGVSPGPAQQTPSQQLYATGQQLKRLARVLPPAANGDIRPLNTPVNELEQLQMLATRMFMRYMQDPWMASLFKDIEPLIKESAELDYKNIIIMANSIVSK